MLNKCMVLHQHLATLKYFVGECNLLVAELINQLILDIQSGRAVSLRAVPLSFNPTSETVNKSRGEKNGLDERVVV